MSEVLLQNHEMPSRVDAPTWLGRTVLEASAVPIADLPVMDTPTTRNPTEYVTSPGKTDHDSITDLR